MNELERHAFTLAAVALGSVLVWLGTAIGDRRKFSHEKRASLRTAYSRWLTGIGVLTHQVRGLCSLLTELRYNASQFGSVRDEMKIVLATFRDCLHASHEVCLLDPVPVRRDLISTMMEQLDTSYQLIHIHTTHLRMHQSIGDRLEKTGRAAAGSGVIDPETGQPITQELSQLMAEHRNSIMSYLPEFRAGMEEISTRMVGVAETTQKILKLLARDEL